MQCEDGRAGALGEVGDMKGSFVTRFLAVACVVFAAVVPCGAPLPASAGDDALPSGTTTIPFELVDNHAVLSVTLNGKGPFRFAFDTGGANIVDTEVAEKLGLRTIGTGWSGGVGAVPEPVRYASVETLGVGDATLHGQRFTVMRVHAGFGMASAKPVDGLIGFEVLDRFVTTFDYGNDRVVLRTPDAVPADPPAGAHTIPMSLIARKPTIGCTIGGVTGRCIVDTGSRLSLTVMTPFLAAHPSVVPASAAAVGANGFGVGGAAYGRLGRTTLEIGGYTVPEIVTDLSVQTKGMLSTRAFAGNIGGGVLKRFTVTFDYRRSTMTLVPNASFAARETYDRSGTFLIAQGGKIAVADVRPGTPAAQAGLAAGDVIATVDGKDAAALGLAAIRDAFRGAAGTTIQLGVTANDGSSRTAALTLADYV
jgi:Aspartyl protease/PDZ domain